MSRIVRSDKVILNVHRHAHTHTFVSDGGGGVGIGVLCCFLTHLMTRTIARSDIVKGARCSYGRNAWHGHLII